MNKRSDYYDVDIDIERVLVDSGAVDELFYLRDLKQRKLFINDAIEQFSVHDVVRHIMQFNAEDKGKRYDEREPIKLYITSCGGEVDAGFELIDVIRASETPVYTINLGCWYSMAFLIGIAGHKRYATKTAKLLMHDGSVFTYNSGAKAQDQMEFQKRVEKRIRDFVIERSNVTAEEYDGKLRVEWYMFADEAKEKGLIDVIIGEDCPLSEVV